MDSSNSSVNYEDDATGCVFCHGTRFEEDGIYCRLPEHGIPAAEAESATNDIGDR